MSEEVNLDNFNAEGDTVSGIVLHQKIIRRVAFDLDAKEFAVLTLDEQTFTDFSFPDPKPEMRKRLSGFSLDKNGILTSFSDGRRTRG